MNDLRGQLLIAFLPAGLLLAILGIAAFGYGKDIGQFLREPQATAGIHPLAGFVSNLGVLLWAASASVSLFAGTIVRRTGRGEAAGFLISSGCLSAYLCGDEFFQIHEDLAKRYLGVEEAYVYAAIVIAVLTYLVRYRHQILGTSYFMLILGIAFLGASLIVDAVFEPFMQGLGQGRILIEDGAKLLGIAAWCSYTLRTSYRSITGSLQNSGELEGAEKVNLATAKER